MNVEVIRKTTIFLSLLCAVPTFAQGERREPASRSNRTNLAGTWVLDTSKSDLKGYDRDLRKGITLVITHQEPEIKIFRKFRSEGKDYAQNLVYYTDRRGEKNPMFIGDGTIESKTFREGRSILTKFIYRTPTPYGIMSSDVLSEWELSSDGMTLIITVTYGQPWYNPPRQMYSVQGYPIVEKRIFKRVT